MNAVRVACVAAAAALFAANTLADPATFQPPMNDFTQAFYRCDGGVAFMISYDSDQPTTAEMVTNDDGKHHALKRTTAPSGASFAGGGAKFWTDGKAVTVAGTKSAFKNCKIKAG